MYARARVMGFYDDDFDVLADGIVVGRIMRAAAAPEGTPWMWTLAFSRRARPRWPRSPRAGGRIDQLALLPLGQLILTTLSRESICRAKSCRADRCRRMAHALLKRVPDLQRAPGRTRRRGGKPGCL